MYADMKSHEIEAGIMEFCEQLEILDIEKMASNTVQSPLSNVQTQQSSPPYSWTETIYTLFYNLLLTGSMVGRLCGTTCTTLFYCTASVYPALLTRPSRVGFSNPRLSYLNALAIEYCYVLG